MSVSDKVVVTWHAKQSNKFTRGLAWAMVTTADADTKEAIRLWFVGGGSISTFLISTSGNFA